MTQTIGRPDVGRPQTLSECAHELIPGGAHTYSKGDDQFPANAPRFLVRGEGARVWDPEGNEYLDWAMGLRTAILGYSHPVVVSAAAQHLSDGSNLPRPTPLEVELAEILNELIPCADMVKLSKNGSNTTTAAVKLARAFTGREHVALCSETAFFSFDDWFIVTTPMKSGIPRSVAELSLSFEYNDVSSLERLFAEHPGKIAAVIMEPAFLMPPRPGFLRRVQELTRANGALLIFDEMITGFRWHLRGAQTYFGVTPDLATFGKALANGFSVSALVGRRDVMELGGIRHDGQKVFLLSTTHGAEIHSLAAAVATLNELRTQDVVEHLWRIGRALQDGFNGIAEDLGIGAYASCLGFPCSPAIVCRGEDGEVSLEYRTLFLEQLTERNILIPYIAPSYAHSMDDVERTLIASRAALKIYRQALEARDVRKYLRGPAVKPVFRAHN